MSMNFTKCQLLVFLFVLLLSIGFFIVVYMCPYKECLGKFRTNVKPTLESQSQKEGVGSNSTTSSRVTFTFSHDDLNKQRLKTLNFEGEDVFVYLHVQKTGGSSFGKHLVHNLDFRPHCKCIPGVKKCECFTKNRRVWLVSRHSTGWICGLHADWTELNSCVDKWFQKNDVKSRTKRRYHYISFVRNPVDRFLSEWQHVSRGATWKSVRLHCNGRSATIEEVPFCYTAKDWSGVTFDEFLSCKHNLAFNRLTRMLADLSKVNCYNNSHLDPTFVRQTMLQSAKDNLRSFAFFGVLEFQQATQFLFEHTFGIRFIDNFQQRERTHIDRIVVTEDMRERVAEGNRLDILLYQYAKDLFLQRVKTMEKLTGYTVTEYFDSVRDEGDAERDDDEELFEDTDEEGETETSYPSESSA